MEVKRHQLFFYLALCFMLNWIGTGFMYANIQLQANDSSESRHQVVEFDESLIESYQADDDYNYFKYKEQESAWQKLQNWLSLQWNKFLNWLLSDISEGNFWNYLALMLKILFIVGLGVLIVWLFNKYYVVHQKTPPEDKSTIHLSEDERLIRQKDLTQLIEEAEVHGNYRLASRYLFLNLLKHLKDYNLIDYQFEKTNADYKSEISDQDLKADFEYASRFYEFVWYGDFKLEAPAFRTAKMRFETFINHILNQRAYG